MPALHALARMRRHTATPPPGTSPPPPPPRASLPELLLLQLRRALLLQVLVLLLVRPQQLCWGPGPAKHGCRRVVHPHALRQRQHGTQQRVDASAELAMQQHAQPRSTQHAEGAAHRVRLTCP